MSQTIHLYDGDIDNLVSGDQPQRVSLLPSGRGRLENVERIRILWGQDMLRDVLDGRYRTVVCGVNDTDNSHGIIAQIVNLVQASQWNEQTVTNYARVFHDSVSVHAARDSEPYILKYDLDSLLVLALLKPKGRDHFTLDDLGRGFATVSKMLKNRSDRGPVCSVSFLGAQANRLIEPGGDEPSFETVLRTMYQSGYRGDIYPIPSMWEMGEIGVFPTYPFPEGLERMREGSS